MKTTLPKRSLFMKERLEDITKETLEAAKKQITMIILFGSYARGSWVYDEYMEDHTTYTYKSDLDIMVIVKGKYGNHSQLLKIQDSIERRLKRTGLRNFGLKDIPVTIVVEPITVVNKYLGQGQYFYSDVKKEGILLYDSGEFQLAEPRELAWEEVKEIAQKYYSHWFERGSGFLHDNKHALQREDLALAAFYLHQATESFYHCIQLVFSGYKEKLHDIEKLRSLASNYNDELWSIFAYSSEEEKKCFELLKRAYIEARYSYDYKIGKEQLLYLIGEVEKLQKVTERICLEYINIVF